jgi:hypothetical protein
MFGTPIAFKTCVNDCKTLPTISTELALQPDVVRVNLLDARIDALSLFEATAEDRRAQLAEDAWVIGLRALKNAHAETQEARLQDVGKSLLSEMDRELRAHVEAQQRTIKEALADFFDPNDGKLSERLNAFLDNEGVLAQVLRDYLAPERGVLAETLARQVGEHSPLFKKLSPTDSEGLVHVLTSRLQGVLEQQQATFGRALDPLEKDGAVGRFLRSLREELQAADDDRAKQLATALAALDANDEASLLNRLVRETEQARRSLLLAINPNISDSPMAVLKTALESLLKEHAQSQKELMEAQRQRQERFEKDVQSALARLETRKDEEQKSTRGGFTFQQAVSRFTHEALKGGPYVAEDTGNTTGAQRACKVGDLVVRFTAESAFDGSAVVLEAKRDSSYTVARALDEMETARTNREAGAGVFIMAASHAPEGFPEFARYGKDLLVTWDDEDAGTDAYLHAALLAALSLATRKKSLVDSGDIKALEDVGKRIEAEISRLAKMKQYNDNIRRNSDSISEEIRRGEDKLDLLLRKAGDVLKALDVEVQDEEEERKSPVSAAHGSLERASALLRVDFDEALTA